MSLRPRIRTRLAVASFQRLRHRGGHVLFIVLREYFVRYKSSIGAQTPLRHYACTLAEQIRQYARVTDRHVVSEVGHHEAHLEAAGRALHGALGHHATESKPLTRGYLSCGHL